MTKFHVTVLEHRNHTVEVDAADEDEAIEAVQQRLYGKPTRHEVERLDALQGLSVISTTTTLVEATEVDNAERAAVHADFRAAGFTEEWTGGNCRAWRKQLAAHSLWISAEDASLGGARDEPYALVLCERHGDESKGEGEDHDIAATSGTQSEVLALARFAAEHPRDFALAHPL